MRLSAPLVALLMRGDALAFVALTIVILFALVGISAVALFLHHTLSHLRRARLRRRMAIATDLLAPTIVDPDSLGKAVARAAQRAGPRATASALRQFRMRIKGDFALLLTRHLETLGEVDRLGRLGGARRAWLRRAAARGLGECGGRKARAYLVWLLTDRDPEVRRTARNALLAGEDPQGVHAAINSYFGDVATHQGWKAAFYARLAAVAPEELRTLFAKGRLAGIEEKLALEALGDVRDEAAASLAAERLDAPEPELRATAVRVLGKLRRDEFRQRILRDLSDPIWFVRAAAARAFETLGPDPAVDEALTAALTDREWWVRANAARALSHRGEAGVRRLVSSLEADDHYARDAALSALTSAGALTRLVDRLRGLAAAHPEDQVLAGLLARAESAHA